MRVIIVDDDFCRSSELKAYLLERLSLPGSAILVCSTSDDAKRHLRSTYYDALILDVVIPKREGERPSSENGSQLLDQLSREAHLRKPERIIGITSHVDDIANFRNDFLAKCVVVVEARRGASQWKKDVAEGLSYTGRSKLCRFAAAKKTVVFTVHGIRTYGQWQSRLRTLIESETDLIEFHNYKYGYFSALFFLMPMLRDLEVRRLVNKFGDASVNLEDRSVVVFCHSFGTYLVTKAMENLLTRPTRAHIRIVFSGSVLPHNYDWRRLTSKNVSIVNDCGESDYVLWLSAAFALGLGMAGKCGFTGFNNDRLMNRYFAGGHSLYFQGDQFMKTYWMPLLDTTSAPEEIDLREEAGQLEMVIETGIRSVCAVKPFLYFGAVATATLFALTVFSL